MNISKIKCLLIVLLLASSKAVAADPDLAKIFAKNNTTGTLIVSSLSGTTYIHNVKRTNIRYSAASTFKIPNSLIALENGLVKDASSQIKWDGKQREFKAWNSDQTLQSAFQLSCVWCYQEFARAIGTDKYKDYIAKMSYGQLTDAFSLTRFWLDSSLTISATEQIQFLKRVYARTLPFSPHSFDVLSDIMIVEQNSDYVLRAKTGWAAAGSPEIGWYVGYIEQADDVWFLALNLDVVNKADLALRKSIVFEALQVKGIK